MIRIYEKDGKRLYEAFISMRDLTGKQVARRKKGITTERDAKNAEYELRRELELLTDVNKFWTWERWHEECIKRVKLTCKRATVFQYDQRLKHHLPADWVKKDLKSITTEEVYELTFNGFEQSMTATSRKILFMLVKRIFQTAVEEGILGRNPAIGIKLRRETRAQMVLTATEAQKFLSEAHATNHRFYPIWVMALKTGMRSGEMYALTWADIDLEAGVIQINKQWTNKDGICQPKNREWRTIPIGQDLKTFLTSYKRTEPGFTARLFDARSGAEQTRTDYVLPRHDEWTNGMQAQVTREFCEAIDVTPTKFHDLRATFITNLLASGVPLVKVMSIVGHRKMSTTDIYLTLAGVEVKGATDTMGYEVPRAQEPGRVLAFQPK